MELLGFPSQIVRFRMPPREDLPQNQDGHVRSGSLFRVLYELGFVSCVIAGVFIQRNGIIHQESTGANVAKAVVVVAGAWTFGCNMGCLLDDFLLSTGTDVARPLPPYLRRRNDGWV
ncbi:hypothetical protein ACP4OV_014547 [Aristida adscensionis]